MDKITTPTGIRMLQSVSPGVYNGDDYVLSIFEANGKIMEEISQVIEQLKYEIYPQNATWTLSYWEDMLGIKYQKLPTDTERVQRVLFELNKYFTVTKYRLENIVNTFIDKKNAIIEDVDGEYAFTIVVPVESRVSPGLREAVEEVKPAHLLAIYERVIEDGAVVIIDDDYSFPIYYRLTSKFWGVKDFVQFDPSNLSAISDLYGFEIKYPTTKKEFLQIDSDPVALIDDTYNFEQKFRESGKMLTLNKRVSQMEGLTSIIDDVYNFKQSYRLCGQFNVEGE